MNWDVIEELILNYAECYKYNLEVQSNKNIGNKLKSISQKELEDQKKTLKTITGCKYEE